jgi:hypothetical protein
VSFVYTVAISVLVITFTSWLAGRFPVTAGFIVALPITTLLVLPLSYLQHGSPDNSVLLAKSIFLAVPISLLFFVPFVFYERVGLSFWQTYVLGIVFLVVGFGAHRAITRFWFTGA